MMFIIMAITRKQQKNEFDDCRHGCVCVDLSENSFTQCFLPNIFQKKGERRYCWPRNSGDRSVREPSQVKVIKGSDKTSIN